MVLNHLQGRESIKFLASACQIVFLNFKNNSSSMKIRSTQGKNNTNFSFRYELISYTFDILHKISKNENKFQTFSFTNLVEAKRTNCCLLLTNSVVSNLQDHWVHDHWGDRTLVLFSFPIS